MKDFSALPEFLQAALARLNITEPTPIQAGAVPPALEGKDVLGTAQTGTGKTFAFLLPLAARLAERPEENALILSPTRELAQQTYAELKKLSDPQHPLKAALVIGGDNLHKQYADLRGKPRVVIATPGRLIDHIGRKTVNLKQTRYLVLDETDRMLDMGFIADIRRIADALPAPRQMLLFSATLPREIVSLANEFLHNPVRVQIGSVVSPADLVVQEIVHVGVREKLPQLLHELETRRGSVLIFTRTKHGADRLAKQLKLYGQKANALHGDLRQNRRRQVLEFFRNETVRILVATDVAARGIDVPHIAHVINYDLPQCPEDYIHRIGRTGRAGAVGSALSLISDDGQKWKDICKVTKFAIPVKTVQKNIAPLPAPKFVAQEEGDAHSKNRRKAASNRSARPSKATQTAKRLLAEGEVHLPQDERVARAEKQLEEAARAVRGLKPADKNAPAHRETPARAVQPKPASKQGGKVLVKEGVRSSKAQAAGRRRTFHKAAEAQRVLEAQESNPFRTVKVGASKKKLARRRKNAASRADGKSVSGPKAASAKPGLASRFFSKFFKRKRR